jgi:hypothetical protein
MPMEDVVDEMKAGDIQVLPMRQSLDPAQGRDAQQYPAFEIRFAYRDRFIAQKATWWRGSWKRENVREVSQQTVSTTQFLRDQWETAKKKLNGLEYLLSVFRARNMGRLPEEQQNNYQQLAAMQAQKLNLNMSMNSVNQEKLLYDDQFRIYRDQLGSLKVAGAQAARPADGKLVQKDREIAQYEDSLATARERHKENHPDIQRLVKLLAAARTQREAMAQQPSQESGPAAKAPMSPQLERERRDLDAQIQRMQGLVQAKDLEMEDYSKQAAELDATVRT